MAGGCVDDDVRQIKDVSAWKLPFRSPNSKPTMATTTIKIGYGNVEKRVHYRLCC